MHFSSPQTSLCRILLVLYWYFLDYGSSFECYISNCKSSTSTKCRLFPRWSVETRECNGTCYLTRNASKNFVYVNRGCTGYSTPGCRPVVHFNSKDPDDYYKYEACYCHMSLCNGGLLATGINSSVTILLVFIIVISNFILNKWFC